MTLNFYENFKMNGSSFVKIPSRSIDILDIENDDKFCFLLPIWASLHPSNKNRPNRRSNDRQYFKEINTDGFDFTNGFRTSDVHIVEKIKMLSLRKFKLGFCQDQNERKQKFLPVETGKNIPDKVIDWINYKNHYVFIEKIHFFK